MTGKTLGQYKVLSEIGRGGMGIVYKAYQSSLNREVALKILPQNLAMDESLVKRFHREAEAAARLSHPNIVQIFDISEIDGIHFFAMEYLKGDNLTHKIEREGALSIKEAVRIIMAVADALSYSHEEGIVHRDIKPGNIMIDPQGHVKVTDFGLARAIESSRLTMAGTIIGTPEYMSPEQARGDTLDGRSDLYSIGIVLYEALTGKIPFGASTPFAIAQKQIYDPLPLPRMIRPEIPEILEQIILKATQKDPSNRYRSGEDLKKDLEAFISGSPLERITPTVAVPSQGPAVKEVKRGFLKKRRWGRVAVAIIIFIVSLSLLDKALKKPKVEEEVPPEEKTEELSLPAEELTEEDAKKLIEDAKGLIAQGAYADARAMLEEFLQKFPEHPQINIIPQWIKELQDKEAEIMFNEVQALADSGELVQAILKFNEIAMNYPESPWGAKANEKVQELEGILKERDAEKEFFKAQDLKRQNKFIEATQLYQGIIERFPLTTWAEKSEEEINRLKDAQARLKKVPLDRKPSKEKALSFKEELEYLVKSDKEIMHFLIDEDAEGLAQYLQENYFERLKSWAVQAGISSEEFAYEASHRMVEDMKKEFGKPQRPPAREERRQKFSSEETKKIIADMKTSDPRIEKLARDGDRKRLASYLWSEHQGDLQHIAKAIGIPGGRIGQPFSHMIARYLTGDSSVLEMEREQIEDREFEPQDREESDYSKPKDKHFEKFKTQTRSNETLQKYIEKRDAEGLMFYLMSRYYEEIKNISKQLNRPFRDVAWEFSERLVYETEEPKY